MAVLHGLLNQRDLYNTRVTEVGVETVVRAIQQSVAEHNRQLDALTGLFVRKTTAFKTRYKTPVVARLQPMDDSGRARPVKPFSQYDVAFPIQGGGIAWGHNYVTGIKMTVEEVAAATSAMLDADFRWMRDHILAALFLDGSWSFVDDDHGTLTVKGLASGDTDTYNVMAGADAGATDDHVKGAGSLTAAVFTDIYNELKEHPENMGDVVTFVPTASRSTVEGLTGFIEIADPNIQQGANTATINGALNVPIPGTLFGYIEGNWVAEWRSMPSNYLISVTTEGEKPLAQREDMEAELQGFQEVARRDDHPWYERQYLRRAGFGAWNRVGGIVYETDNATYSVPTNYSSPMP